MDERQRNRLQKLLGQSSEDLLERIGHKALSQNARQDMPWHLNMILADGQDYLLEQEPVQATAYSRYINITLKNVLTELVTTIEPNAPISYAFVAGPTALGFEYVWMGAVNGQAVPPRTSSLINSIYAWLFSNFEHSKALGEFRFLGREFIKPVDIFIRMAASQKYTEDELIQDFYEEVSRQGTFLPPINIHLVREDDVLPSTFISSRCIFGDDAFEIDLKQALAAPGKDILEAYSRLVVDVAELIINQKRHRQASSPATKSDEAVRRHFDFMGNRNSPVILPESIIKQKSAWWTRNEAFFAHLIGNVFDQLLLEDATKALGDAKGAEKANQYTINNVIGLKRGDEIIPASDVILKIRGLPGFREDVNHRLDLLKEFSVYAYLQEMTGGEGDFIPQGGPLLVNFDKVNLPEPLKKAGTLTALFIEKINLPENENVFTTRAIRVSDFWSRGACLKRIFRDSKSAGISLSRKEVVKAIDRVARKLWLYGISLDYADISFFFGADGKITQTYLFDFERVSFGELVDERHVVLDTLIDLKTRLRPKFWERTLLQVYDIKSSQSGFSLEQVGKMLNPVERKREFVLRSLRKLRNLVFMPGTRFGFLFWEKILSLMIFASRKR